MYKLFHNLYIGTSGMPSPTDIEETFVFNFVGDGFIHVPFTKIALQFLCGHGSPCPYVNVAIIPTKNYGLSFKKDVYIILYRTSNIVNKITAQSIKL